MWSRDKYTVNSLLTDTSLKRTRGVGPCRTSVIYLISLQGGHLSKADSRSCICRYDNLFGIDYIYIVICIVNPEKVVMSKYN